MEDLDLDGKLILKWILKLSGRRRLYLYGSRQRQVSSLCEHGNEHLDSISCGKFLVFLRN